MGEAIQEGSSQAGIAEDLRPTGEVRGGSAFAPPLRADSVADGSARYEEAQVCARAAVVPSSHLLGEIEEVRRPSCRSLARPV